MSVAMFTKYLFKAFAISCGSVKLWTLKILDGAKLDDSFNEISFFIPFHQGLFQAKTESEAGWCPQ